MIGIVTVLYNSGKVLDGFFHSLDKQKNKDFILYIIDNASSDNSLELSETFSRDVSFQVKIFSEKNNWGIAKGNNIGISAAIEDGCEYVLLANNDIEFSPNTIENLKKGLLSENADMAVPKIKFWDSRKIWCVGGCFSPWRGIAKHYGFNESDNGQYDKNYEMTYSPTCFMLIKVSVFKDVGMMDEKYFVYYDDTDFVWRSVIKHSKKLVYIYNSEVLHKVSSTTGGGESDFTLYYSNRNNRYFIRKNLSGFQKMIALTYRSLSSIYKKRKYPKAKRQIVAKALKDAGNM